jgi:hypothetical protein
MSEINKPKVSSGAAQKELDKVERQFDEFKSQVDSLTLDRMNQAPKEEGEPQAKLSSKEIRKNDPILLKPQSTISSREKFNENFREDYNYAKERVTFVAQNNEIIGESITVWTKRFPGVPAEKWVVPVNVPVNGPRYLAEQIKGCTYHRLTMEDRPTSSDRTGVFTGAMIADVVKQRLDAIPCIERKSIFMGASGF